MERPILPISFETSLRAAVFLAWIVTAPLLGGCAHSYHYRPEVSGDGAIWASGGVSFLIPASQPKFKMKLLARSLKGAPSQAHLPSGTQMIFLRMYFEDMPGGVSQAPALAAVPAAQGKGPTKGPIQGPMQGRGEAYLDPREQILRISDNLTAPPTLIRADTRTRPRVLLIAGKRQKVDLFFALPQGMDASDLQWFSLEWRVHIGNRGDERQVTRFDRRDSAPEIGAGYNDDPAAAAPGFMDNYPSFW